VRIGLASDSHGNVAALARALDLFRRCQVERVFFLGGRVADVDAALTRRKVGAREAPVPQSDAEFLDAFRGALARQEKAPATDPLEGRIVRVASRACPEYQSGQVPKKQVDLLEGHIASLVHDKAEWTRDDIANAVLLFHGNAAAPALVQIGPRCFVTPGHLRSPAPEGRPATCAVVDVGAREVVLTVFGEDGVERRRDRVSIGASGKMSVR